jgi:hypothetical protein
MKSTTLRWIIPVGILAVCAYAIFGDSSVPQSALDSVSLLKKPIEDLLPDLQDTSTSTENLDQPVNLEPYEDLHASSKLWNEMRRLIETGKPIYTPLPTEVVISSVPAGRLAPAVPPPPGFTVQLPYESRLTVSGRKTIGFDYKSSQYANSTYTTQQNIPSYQSNLELQQQLQVRINGQVGRKVTVNVDFDDTKEDKKDISIVYKGDPDEVVQRAAFGDINLSLPQTEFAGYNKQVFGASAELRYKAIHAYLVGSRTKGTTETKEFMGNVILQRLTIPDTSYIRRRYYHFTSPLASAIAPNTETLYLDTQDTTRSPNSITLKNQTVTGTFPNGIGPITYTGNFVQLARGIDYTVDPVLGVITLKNPVASNAVIAATFTMASGPVIGLTLIKYDETQSAPAGNLSIPPTEDLTHYSLGVTKIVRDDGQGNFIFNIQDLNNNNVSSGVGLNYLPNNAGNVYVDFEAGTFYLINFRLDTKNPSFSDIYATSPNHHLSFFTEFSSRVKTYTLRPNIVLNSEQIVMNGRKLARDVDYFIDYESGFITFYNEQQITQDTRITATYDYSPFGIAGAQQDTLVGERTELSFYPISPILSQSLIGSTVLYDFAAQQVAAPDIRQTSSNYLLTEGDIHLQNLVFDPIPMLKSSFIAEGAQSHVNPNTFGKAIIDNMEGIVDETDVGMSVLSWQIAANPIPSGGGSPTVAYAGALATNLGNEIVPTLNINPNASALPSDTQQVLDLNYDLTRSNEASIAAVLSPTGLDFSKKLFLQMWVYGDGSLKGTEMNVTLGQISEDADGKGGNPDGTPKTEDTNHNNILDPGEDIGWSYVNPDGTVTMIGAGNGRLDSEDFNRNGRLDPENQQEGGNLGYSSKDQTTQALNPLPGGTGNRVDFSGWQFIQVPLNISSSTLANDWSAIEEVRISLRNLNPGGARGTVKIAQMAVVGNKYIADASLYAGSTITVSAVNNVNNPNYISPSGPDFDSLNQVNTALSGPQPSKKKEQSLQLQYAFDIDSIVPKPSTVSAKATASPPYDFTPYGSIRFFLYGDGKNENFFFQAGSDTDYFQFSIPVNWTGWREVYIKQVTPGGSQLPNNWQNDPANITPGIVTISGSPNLTAIGQLRFGIQKTTSGQSSGQVWIDELHGADVITRVGNAGKLQADFDLAGWGSFGGVVRDIDPNFQTIESAVTNQARHEQKSYLTLTRLPWFPMKFTQGYLRTETPNVQIVPNSTLVSVNQQGRVDEYTYSGQGTLQVPRYPKLGLAYDSDDTQTDALFREDKTQHYGSTLDYNVPLKSAFLPRNLQLGYKLTDYNLDFTPGALLTASDPYLASNTKDVTHDITARMSFQPLSKLTFNPNYSLSLTREHKDAIVDSNTLTTTALDYEKLRSQTSGFDSTFTLAKWFAPRLRYSMNTRETYGIPLSSQTTGGLGPSMGDFKTVDRTDTGEFAWDFAARDITKLKAFQSLNVASSYLMEDGDSWNNVGSGYNSLSILSVRQSLNPGNAEATREQLTIRDTYRSTQRWSPFDWASGWSGHLTPFRTLSLTNTVTETRQRQETTGTPSTIVTRILPDMILSMSQTEYLFGTQNFMSNSQLNLKAQYKNINTYATSLENASTVGGDWRFTLRKKVDLFFSYTRTTDNTFDEINNVISNDAVGSVFSAQAGFNVGKWRFTPKYDQSVQTAVNSSGQLTTDLTTRTPALQVYADLFLPAGLKMPFSDMIIFSNRIRTTTTLSLAQRRSSLNATTDNTDTYSLTTSEDYELTSNMRLTLGLTYSYIVNKEYSDQNYFSYEFNTLMTIQF